MAFTRRIITKTLDLLNLQRHNDNFADIESDLTNHRSRLTTVETEQANQDGRINNLVAGAGNSNAEIVDAREDYTTLRERLDTEFGGVSAQLAEDAILRPVSMRTNLQPQRPIASFIDDDGNVEVFTILRKIANEKNFRFNSCVYVEPLIIGNDFMMTPSQMLQLQSEGHEILSHGYVKDAQITTLPESQWQRELGVSKMYLKSLGLDVNSFVYQGGAYNQDVLNIIPAYYDSAWAIDQGFGINKANGRPFDGYKGQRYAFDASTLADAKAQVDALVANGGWLVFMTHCWFPQWYTAEKQQDLKDLIDYIRSKGIDIVTVKEGLEIHGNVIDYGRAHENPNYFKVDKQGMILNERNRFYSLPANTVMVNTPPSFFKENSITIAFHNGATTATGFPSSNLGTIITYNGLANATFQEWHPYHIGNNVYSPFYYRRKRKNVAGTDEWLEFEKINYTPATQEEINGADPNLSTYPLSSAGQLTKSGAKGNGYYTEDYDVHDRPRRFRRYKKTDGTMSDWWEYAFKLKVPVVVSMPTLAAKAYTQITFNISSFGLTTEEPIVMNAGSTWVPGLIETHYHNGSTLYVNLFNATDAEITARTLSINCYAIRNFN